MTSVEVVADPVAEAEAELERIHAAIAAAAAAMESARGGSWSAAKAIESADELEGAVALGEVDAAEAARARADAVAGRERATAEYQRNRAAIQALRARVPAAERAVDEAKLKQLAGALEAPGQRGHVASVRFAKAVKSLAAVGVELAEARSEIDELERKAWAIADKLQVERPYAIDEATWPVDDLPALTKLVADGPRTPAADSDREAAKAARVSAERDEQDVRRVAHEVALGHDSALDQLPERLHAAAIEKARELYDERNRALIAEDDRNRAALQKIGAEGIGTTPMAEQIANGEKELIGQAAAWLADHGIDENANALRRVPPWLRPQAIAQAQEIRRERLREFARRNAENRGETLADDEPPDVGPVPEVDLDEVDGQALLEPEAAEVLT